MKESLIAQLRHPPVLSFPERYLWETAIVDGKKQRRIKSRDIDPSELQRQYENLPADFREGFERKFRAFTEIREGKKTSWQPVHDVAQPLPKLKDYDSLLSWEDWINTGHYPFDNLRPPHLQRVYADSRKAVDQVLGMGMDEYLSGRLFPRGTGHAYVVTVNDFPNALPDDTSQLVFWIRDGGVQPEELKRVLGLYLASTGVRDEDYLLIETPGHLRTMGKTAHFHIWMRSKPGLP